MQRSKGPSTILIVTWMGGGNVRPVFDTAADLVRRGHTVHVLSNPALETRAKKTGAGFHSFTRIPPHDPSSPSTDIVRAYEGRNIGETNNLVAQRLMFGPAEAVCRDTLDLIDRIRPEIILADYVLLGAMLAAEVRGVPYFVVCDGMQPLPSTGRPRGSSTYSYLFERMVERALPAFNELRASYQLAPIQRATDLYSSAAHSLVMTHPALGDADYPKTTYAGPQFAPPEIDSALLQRRRQTPFLVLGAFSTIHTPEQGNFIQRLAEALARLEVDAEIGTGSAPAETIVSPSPRVKISPFIALEQLLPAARVLVNHAGNGTVVRAMAAGVPQLCVPFIQDQHDYARRVATLEIGSTIPKSATSSEIEAALKPFLQDDRFLARAEEERARIVREHQDSMAAKVVEAAIDAPEWKAEQTRRVPALAAK